MLERPDHSIVGVLGEPNGRRLVTIELVRPMPPPRDSSTDRSAPISRRRVSSTFISGMPTISSSPIATLQWRVGTAVRNPAFPLVAISPDGKTVAVASTGGSLVKLYSARDGAPLKRMVRFGPGEMREEDLEVEPQAELTALALGPHNSLATAGNTAGGVAIRIWNLDSPSSQTSLNPPEQSYTRMMRFSPQGNLLAIVGSGPIELWDPVALNLVAVLRMSDQATDVAFAPDGRTLAAVSQGGHCDTLDASTIRRREPSSADFETLATDAGVQRRRAAGRRRLERRDLVLAERPLSGNRSSGAHFAWISFRHSDRRDRAETFGIFWCWTARDPRAVHGKQNCGAPRGPRRRSSSTNPADWFFTTFRDCASIIRDRSLPKAHRHSGFPPPASVYRGFPARLEHPMEKSLRSFVRRISYLWRAESPNELIPLDLPARPTPEPPRNTNRRTPPGVSEPPGTIFQAVQIGPGGRKLYTIEQAMGSPRVLRYWEIEFSTDGKSAHARELESVSPPDGIINVVLGRDGKLLAVADRSGQVSILDATTLVSLSRLKTPGENIWPPTLAFSPDGTELAVGSERGAISLWSLSRPSRPQLRLQLPGHRARVNCLAYEPKGRRLASATVDSIVEVWDLDIVDRELVRLKLAD